MSFLVASFYPHVAEDALHDSGLPVLQSVEALFRETVMRTMTPHLASIAIATEIRRLGHPVRYVDLALTFGFPFSDERRDAHWRKIESFLSHESFDAVFLSYLTASEYLTVKRFLETLRRTQERTITILGGYQAKAESTSLFTEFPALDYIHTGDFEHGSASLLSALVARDTDRLDRHPALISRARPAKPPDRTACVSSYDYSVCGDYVPLYDYIGSTAIKGCPFSCSFCLEPQVRPGFALRDVEDTLGEMRSIVDLARSRAPDREYIWGFGDPVFGGSLQWMEGFAKTVSSSGFPIPWVAQDRVDLLSDRKLSLYKEAGCAVIHVGLESFSPEVLLANQKTRSPAAYLHQFDDLLRRTAEIGMRLEYNLVFGLPGDTAKTLKDNWDAIAAIRERHSHVNINLNLFRPFPGTPTYEDARHGRNGKLLAPEWWKKGYIAGLSVLYIPPGDLSGGDLLDFFERMYEDGYCYSFRGVRSDFRAYLVKGEVAASDWKQIAVGVTRALRDD